MIWMWSLAFASDSAEDAAFADAKRRHLRVMNAGNTVLASWATVNLAGGGLGAVIAEEPRPQGFWAGNAGWNVVNLGVATAGFAGVGAKRKSIETGPELRRSQDNFERALLVNVGLDVAYMMAGLAVRERALRIDDPFLQGVGDALLVQGGFLFVFDIGLFTSSRVSRRRDRYSPFSNTMP